MKIFATSGQITIKFYPKHHKLGERLHEVLSQIGSELVSMATESSHMVIMEKTVSPLFLGCNIFHPIHFILTGNVDMHESLDELEIR